MGATIAGGGDDDLAVVEVIQGTVQGDGFADLRNAELFAVLRINPAGAATARAVVARSLSLGCNGALSVARIDEPERHGCDRIAFDSSSHTPVQVSLTIGYPRRTGCKADVNETQHRAGQPDRCPERLQTALLVT